MHSSINFSFIQQLYLFYINLFRIDMILRWIFPLVIFSLSIFTANAQSKSVYAKKPLWVNMMNDSVNYFEAVKAFNTYWKYHQIPKEEDEIIGEHEKKQKQNEKQNEYENESQLAFQYKKFKWWQRQVEPWVQSDGKILPLEQRIIIEKKLR
jgi:hypothetical protein